MSSATNPVTLVRTREVPVVVRRGVRYWQSWVAGAALLIVIARMAFDNGGYFADSYLSAGVIAYVVLGVLLLLRVPRFAVSSGGLVALASLAAFTAWTALSTDWSTAHQAGVEAMQRDIVYLGLFALALMAAGSGRYARQLVWGTLGVIVAIVGAALLSRLSPHLISSPPASVNGYRLNYPLGYWNALGGLGAMGTVLAVGLAADLRTKVGLRAVTAGLAVVLATATYLTLSRGAIIAVTVGIIVLSVLTVRHGSLLLTVGIVGGGTALSILRLQSFPTLTDNPALPPGQVAAGRTFGRELVAIVVAVMVLNGLVGLGRRSEPLMSTLRRGRRPLQIAGAIAVVAALLVGVSRAGTVGHGVNRAGNYVSKQFDNFWSTSNSSSPAIGSSRLTSLNGTRGDTFSVAWDGFTAHPLIGDGVGSFRNRWLKQRPIYENVRNAHSLEIETLSEEGLIGMALLLLFIGAVITAAVRARLSPLGLGRGQAAAVSAACAVWLVHSAFDWDWQMTGMTAIALALAATLLPARGDERPGGPRRRAPAEPFAEPAAVPGAVPE